MRPHTVVAEGLVPVSEHDRSEVGVDWNDGACVASGTQFTCFTGTKSTNTVSEHNRSEVGVDSNDGACVASGTQFPYREAVRSSE